MNIVKTLANILDGGSRTETPPENMARPPRSAPQPAIEAPQQAPPGSIQGTAPEKMSPTERRELIPTIVRPTTQQLAGVPNPDLATVRAFDALLAEDGYRSPKNTLAALAELDAPAKRLHAAVEDCARGTGARYSAHLDSLAKRVASGEIATHAEDSWSRADWESDARERMLAFKGELNKILAQAWTIAEPALLEKSEAVNALADRLEAEARPIWEKLSVPFRVPLYVALCRKYAANLADGSRKGAGMPSAMVAGL